MKPIEELTDRELQERILVKNSESADYLKTIYGWITFIGIIYLLGTIAAVITFIASTGI